MRRIVIRCPTTQALVPTGYRTTDCDLASLTEPKSFRCPVCQRVHDWSARDATVEEI